MNIIIAILILGIVIAFHEFGHFIIAKSRGITVREFSIGMGPKLFGFEKGGTQYCLRLLPIGGACVMGEDEAVGPEDVNAFNNKTVWERIAVVFAGPFFNFILAFFFALIVIGIVGYDPAYVLSVKDYQPAKTQAGLQPGDIIKEFNGKKIHLGRELATELLYRELDGNPITIVYERTDSEGEKTEYTVEYKPEYVKNYMLGFYYTTTEPNADAVINSVIEDYPMEAAGLQKGDIITSVDGNEMKNVGELAEYLAQNPPGEEAMTIGYLRNGIEDEVQIVPLFDSEGYSLGFTYNYNYNYREKTNLFGVIKYSFYEVKYLIVSTIKGLGQMITGNISANDIGGPLRIGAEIDNAIEESKNDGILYVVLNLLNWCILLSANLGVMNLLPIPALDGGRLLFMFLEVVRGKPIAKEKEGMVHMIGIILLMLLMVFVFFNDIRIIFFK